MSLVFKYVVVADDLTGANDTGVQFSRYSYQTYVIVSLKNLRRKIETLSNIADVVVFNTESRADKPSTAYKKCYDIAEIIRETGANVIYKKVDSTIRGNIGSELDGIMDGLDRKYAFFTSAFPLNERIIIGGYLIVNGLPVNLTPFSKDPISPVREPNILKLIQQQSKKEVLLINYDIVRQGNRAISKRVDEIINSVEEAIIVFDAVTHEDLFHIAEATIKYRDISVYSGSAGLARELPKALGVETQEIKTEIKASGNYFFVISGSANPITIEQVDIAVLTANLHSIEIKADKILIDPDTEMKRVLNEFRSSQKENKIFGFLSVREHNDLEKAWKVGKDLGLTNQEVSKKIAEFMGQLALELYREVNGDVAGYLVTGGDIAIKVCEKLDIEALEIIDEIDPGVPITKAIRSKDKKDFYIITKAGGFGKKDIITKGINLVVSESISTR